MKHLAWPALVVALAFLQSWDNAQCRKAGGHVVPHTVMRDECLERVEPSGAPAAPVR